MAIAGSSAAGASAAVAAAINEAIKASGAIVRLEPVDFERMLGRMEDALVICTESGRLKTKYEYMTSYRGFVFYTKTTEEIRVPDRCEAIKAKKMWIPT
jgi:hypothetical protein